MKINELPNAPTWLLDATTDGADVAWDSDQHNYIVWRGGVWRGGEWCGGVWRGGEWCGGEWRGGVWCGGVWRDGEWCGGVWRDGEWCGGVWRGGVWCGGVWRGEKLTENLWTVSGLRWPITISQTRMQVGCEIHAFTDWGRFDDVAINKMDRGALKFWRTHKAHLLALCAARSEP